MKLDNGHARHARVWYGLLRPFRGRIDDCVLAVKVFSEARENARVKAFTNERPFGPCAHPAAWLLVRRGDGNALYMWHRTLELEQASSRKKVTLVQAQAGVCLRRPVLMLLSYVVFAPSCVRFCVVCAVFGQADQHAEYLAAGPGKDGRKDAAMGKGWPALLWFEISTPFG